MFLSTLNWNKQAFRQCLVGFIVTIDVILLGAGFTFSATLLPQLENEDSKIQITRNGGTWIGILIRLFYYRQLNTQILSSISSLACVPGTIIGYFFLKNFGRKWSYSIISLSNVFAWGIIANSTQVWHLLFGRALQGLNAGLGYSVCFCFLSEVIDLKYRSAFLNITNIGCSFGMLFVDVMGSFYPFHVSAYVLTCLAAIYFLTLFYLKNTHVWYLQKGEIERARSLYFWYKKETPENVEAFNVECKLADIKVSFKELCEEWKRREFLAPLGVLLWFNTTLMCTGGFGMMLYSVEIMEGVVSIDEYMTTVIIDILRVISAFATIILLENTSVRLVTNLSSIFCATSLLSIAASLIFKRDWSGCSTIALVAILTFNFFFNLGFVNLGNICMGELFTGIGKSGGIAVSGMYFFILYFAFGQLVPVIFDNLGHVVAFILFGSFTVVGGIGLYFIMPETKGVSNEQIRLNFQSKRKKLIRRECDSVKTISNDIPRF